MDQNNQDDVKLNSNYKNRNKIDAMKKYEKTVEEYKALLSDKLHPDNQTVAYEKNVISVFNRLMVAADELDEHQPGAGVFGLIILSLRAVLKLKDKNTELETKVRDLERQCKKLEKRND
jgi:hypothetical protein